MIGIFDSGSGGLSVFKEIARLLPDERYVYFADNANCPYGDKSVEFIRERSKAITELLVSKGAEIIVVACNTATAAAISTLRNEYSTLPVPSGRPGGIEFIGMEPAVKPAALSSVTGVIGVLATAGTLSGSKYLSTKGRFEDDVKIVEHVGKGFVELVEKGILEGPEAESTVEKSLRPLLDANADRIVLGCTHYPFLRKVIEKTAGPDVEVIDPAPAVARHLIDVMAAGGLLSEAEASEAEKRKDCPLTGLPEVELISSGDDASLKRLIRLILE